MKKIFLNSLLGFLMGVIISLTIYPHNIVAAAADSVRVRTTSGRYYFVNGKRYCVCPCKPATCYCILTATLPQTSIW